MWLSFSLLFMFLRLACNDTGVGSLDGCFLFDFLYILLERFTITVSLFLMNLDFTVREAIWSARFIIHSVPTSDDFLYYLTLSTISM